MTPEQIPWLTAAVFAVALLYSSVGHAGASGYLAVMALAGLAPAVMKPTALVLNLLVSSVGAWQFWRAGHFSWRLFWPFAALAVPCAFVGGRLSLPAEAFRLLVGLVLLASSARFFAWPAETENPRAPSRPVALGVGAGLGLLAGLTGTGGGIFLTPLLLMMRWARTKEAAAVSALFILVNSAAGLLGNLSAARSVPALVVPLAIAAVAGGTVGSYCGSRRFPAAAVRRLLAAVLLVAGAGLVRDALLK